MDNSESPFRIELIVPATAGDDISRNCSYLRNLVPVGQLTDGDFEGYRDSDPITSDMRNPLFYWLKEKIVFHQRRGDFGTSEIGPAVRDIAGGVI